MRRQLAAAISVIIALTVLCGVIYPLASTAVAQIAFSQQANGSLVRVNGRTVGSALIGQNFTRPQYFHPRPSAAGAGGYDATASAASNLGPSNPALVDTVSRRAAAYRTENNLPAGTPVPIDAVTASGSGLDPAISVANARIQAVRVAAARHLSVDLVLAAVQAHTTRRAFGTLGEDSVNVLQLNVALDTLE